VSLLGELLGSVFERRAGFFGSGVADARPMEELAAQLVAADGEESARELGRAILKRYGEMTDDEKRGFFAHLAQEMSIAPDAVREMLTAYEAAPSKSTYRAFMQAAEPPRQELIRRLNRVQGGTEKLVEMRADLLRLAKDDAALGALDIDFRHLFASWFNRGFLVLRPISWESPAHVLEKIILYEAVHAIDSWDDLRRRLEPKDRRCFAFFHPAMPDEPLVFVEVALTDGIPGSIQGLLAENRDETVPQEAKTAVFYSISNCQAGLDGISFGNSLIKQVVADLSLALPNLKTFVTLSPMPGFAAWLDKTRALPGEAEHLRSLGAYYLMEAKRPDGRPLDPVARFHLRNGARIEAVHTEADTSPKGQRQSHGLMVNYLYDLGHVAANHELFAAGEGIAASGRVKRLAGAAQKILSPETTA
jgi:malonyl-CoA decarboxylase